jgi:hypothetical protein
MVRSRDIECRVAVLSRFDISGELGRARRRAIRAYAVNRPPTRRELVVVRPASWSKNLVRSMEFIDKESTLLGDPS